MANKVFILHHLPDMNDLPAAERWFYRYHVPEVLRQGPLKYLCFRAVPPPPGAEKYGYYNYKLHENVTLSDDLGGSALTSFTPEVVPLHVVMVRVPVRPTEDFLGAGLTAEEKTILRWFIIFKYPDGVPLEEGEDWYLNTHVPEVKKQPGLIRFFSYRTLPFDQQIASGMRSFIHPKSRLSHEGHRVTEMWYENSNGWVNSVINSPPEYTRPPWAKYSEYPFLEPFKDFFSTFILERPTEDYTREVRPFYI